MTFPTPDMALTHILVVTDVARSRNWFVDVLGADLYREYGGDSAVLSFNGAWLLLVTGSGPTDDKPTVSLWPPCQSVYEILRGRGAVFLTPPVVRGAETRCFLRDPDGHLFEISEYRVPNA